MSLKLAIDYLKSLEQELVRCVEAGQYSEQYLEGYKGAISCLEFAAKESEMPKPVRHAHKVKSACLKSKQPEEDIAACDLEDLIDRLIRITRMLALLEGESL